MFLENVDELINSTGKSRKAFSKDCGIPYTTIDGWFKKGSKNVHMDTLIKLADYFGVSVDWLVGRGNETPEEQLLLGHWRKMDEHGKSMVRMTVDAEYSRVRELELEKPPRCIPHYRTMAAAGFACPVENEDYDMEPVTELVPERAQFAVTIDGDSMEPYIHDGQTVYCEKRPSGIHNDEIGIFCVDGAFYCKQYFTTGQDAYLISLNRARANRDIALYSSGNRSVTYQGTVLMDKKPPSARLL